MGIEQDLAAIERRKQIADMLMQQGAQDIPLQTAGGMVVPVSPLQGISKIANMLSGAYIGKQADKQAANIRQARMDALSNIDFNSPDAASQLAKAGMVEEAVKMRMKQAELTAKEQGKGADPYYQFLPGEGGYLVGNARTGAVTQAMLDGKPVIKASDSPVLQGKITAAKEGQEGVEVTDETGRKYYAPKAKVNPAFVDVTSPSQASNFNFGNLRPPGQSTGFQKFSSPQEGIAAIDRQLRLYGKRGIDTLQEIISTWAPPNENETGKLIQNAAKRTGLDPNQPLNLKDPNVLITLRNAIIRQEQRPSVAEGIIKSQSPAEAARAKAEAELPIKILEDQAKADIGQAKEIATTKAKNDLEIQKTKDEKLAGIKYNAEQASPLLDKAIELLPKTVSGGFDKNYNSALEYLGVSTDRSKAQAQLDAVANDLTSKVPKAPGAQSDIELKYAQKQAGDLANPDKSWETRLSAAKYLKERNEKILKGEAVEPPKDDKEAKLRTLRAKHGL